MWQFCVGLVSGMYLLHGVWTYEHWLQTADLRECGYDPHPISDVAWELERRSLISIETALYYTRSVRSANISAAKCMEDKR